MPKKSKHLILDSASELLQFEAPESTNTYKALSHDKLYKSIRNKANDFRVCPFARSIGNHTRW